MKLLPITTAVLTMSQAHQIDKGLKTSTIVKKPQSYGWIRPNPSPTPSPTAPAETKEDAESNNTMFYGVVSLSSLLFIVLMVVIRNEIKNCFAGSEKEAAANPVLVPQTEIHTEDIESGKIPVAEVVPTAPALTDGTNEALNAPQ